MEVHTILGLIIFYFFFKLKREIASSIDYKINDSKININIYQDCLNSG